MNLTAVGLITDLLSLCDQSNWPEMTGAEFHGYNEAMDRVHELANEYHDAIYAAERAKI